MLLTKLLEENERKTDYLKEVLENNIGNTISWIKNERVFYILSISAKQKGYQLTCFLDGKPISDQIRMNFLDDDFINELVINNALEFNVLNN